MTMLVQDMYDGVKAMIKREMELRAEGGGAAPAKAPAGASAPVKAGPHLK